MARFTLLEDANQAAYNGSTGVDLQPYRDLIQALIASLGKPPAREGYSLWMAVDLDGTETSKATRRRVSTAAAEVGRHVQFHPKSDEKRLIVCLRPAPVARNGKVETVTESAKEVVKEGTKKASK